MGKLLLIFCMVFFFIAENCYASDHFYDFENFPSGNNVYKTINGYDCLQKYWSSSESGKYGYNYYCYGIPSSYANSHEYQSKSIVFNDNKYANATVLGYQNAVYDEAGNLVYIEYVVYDPSGSIGNGEDNALLKFGDSSFINKEGYRLEEDYVRVLDTVVVDEDGNQTTQSTTLLDVLIVNGIGDTVLKYHSTTSTPRPDPDPDNEGNGTDGNGTGTDGNGSTDGSGTDEGDGETGGGSGGGGGGNSGSDGDASTGGGGDSGSGFGDGDSDGSSTGNNGSTGGTGTGGEGSTDGDGSTDGSTDGGGTTNGGSTGTDGTGTGEGEEGEELFGEWSFTEELPDFNADFIQPEEKSLDESFINSIPFVQSLKDSGVHISDESGVLETQIQLGNVSIPFSLDFRPYSEFFHSLGIFVYAFACFVALRFAMRSY